MYWDVAHAAPPQVGDTTCLFSNSMMFCVFVQVYYNIERALLYIDRYRGFSTSIPYKSALRICSLQSKHAKNGSTDHADGRVQAHSLASRGRLGRRLTGPCGLVRSGMRTGSSVVLARLRAALLPSLGLLRGTSSLGLIRLGLGLGGALASLGSLALADDLGGDVLHAGRAADLSCVLDGGFLAGFVTVLLEAAGEVVEEGAVLADALDVECLAAADAAAGSDVVHAGLLNCGRHTLAGSR